MATPLPDWMTDPAPAPASKPLPDWMTDPGAPPQTMGAGRAFALGASQGGTMGFADELGGMAAELLPSGQTARALAQGTAAATGMPFLKDLTGVPESSVKLGSAAMPSATDTPEQLQAKANLIEDMAKAPTSYELVRNRMRSEAKQAKEQEGAAYAAGDVLGGIGASVAGNIVAPGGGTFLRGAAEGAVGGLGNSDADLLQGDVGGAAADTALGAGIGGVTSYVGDKTIGRLFRGAPGAAQETSEGLEDAARERALKASGYIQKDFPRQAGPRARLMERAGLLLDEPGLITPGASAGVIGERAADAAEEYGGDVVGRLLKQADNAGAEFDPSTFLQGARELADEVAGDPALAPQARRLRSLVRGYEQKAAKYAEDGIPFTFQEANKLKGSLQGAIFDGRGDVKANYALANRLQGLFTDEIDNQLEGSLGKDAALLFRDAKMRYGALKGAAEKGVQGANRAAGNNFFGLPDYLAAQAAAAAGGGPVAAAATGALAKAVRGRADSTLAVAFRGLSGNALLKKVASTAPEYLGQFAGPIGAAIARGAGADDAALTATDYLLQQTNPEYREMKKRLAEGAD